MTAIVAAESFRPNIDDFGVVQRIEGDLRRAGVDVVEFKENESLRWTND